MNYATLVNATMLAVERMLISVEDATEITVFIQDRRSQQIPADHIAWLLRSRGDASVQVLKIAREII